MIERERSGIPWAHELVLHLGILVALAVLVLLCCVGCVTPDRGNAPVGTSEVSTAVVATLTGVAVATPRPTFTATPVPTATTMPTSTSTSRCDLGAAFVRDVTVPDNTSVEPGGKFTKTWELQNRGTCHWGDGVRLEHIDGERMAKSGWVAVPRTMAGESAEVSVEMQAPKEVGTYKSTWRMCTEAGECFGDVVYVQIVVQAPTPTSAPTSTRSPREALQGYIDLINGAGLGPYIATVGYDPYLPDPNEVVITVRNSWHYEPKQVRLQAAQNLWKIWATGFCPAEELDSCRIELTDQNGNRVGGSSWLAGSIVKVQD